MVDGAVRVRVPGAILQRERRGKLEGDRGEREEGQGNVVFLMRRRARRGGPGYAVAAAPCPPAAEETGEGGFAKTPPAAFPFSVFHPFLFQFLEVLPHLTNSK